MKGCYVTLSDEGEVEHYFEGTLDEVESQAAKVYPPHHVLVFDGDVKQAQIEDEKDYLPNPIAARYEHAAKSMLRSIGLPRISHQAVVAMSLEEAHARLLPYFPRTVAGEPYKVWSQPASMRRAFINANAKTSKSKDGSVFHSLEKGGQVIPPAFSKGLQLLPYNRSEELREDQNNRLGRQGLQLLPSLGLKGQGLCPYSVPDCRKSCLVFTGKNAFGYPDQIKLSRTEAMLREPVAFMRMFVESIEAHRDFCRKKGVVPFVRPNLLSDIPWEIFYPELFTVWYPKGSGVEFYDYTKIEGREIPPEIENYDLTYSYGGSGTRERTRREWKRGLRIAVVFLVPRGFDFTEHKVTFDGQPVIDGEWHDFRSYDPQGSVIGLRYKPPRTRVVDVGRGAELIIHGVDGDLVIPPGERAPEGTFELHTKADMPVLVKARERLTLRWKEGSRTYAVGQKVDYDPGGLGLLEPRARRLGKGSSFLVPVEKDRATGLYLTAVTPRVLQDNIDDEPR